MSQSNRLEILRRPRRLRRTTSIRALVQETYVRVEDLIAPLFVQDKEGHPEPVDSMPGVTRFSIAGLVAECQSLHALGIRAVAVFPRLDPTLKDAEGTSALNAQGLIPRAVRAIKHAVPELVVITDVALDPYTSHGHDGVLNQLTGEVENDLTVELLCRQAVLEAEAGADWVAPSDMMDGRVQAIREALDEAGHIQTSILAYSAKFASAYYGPFRDAVGSKAAAGGAYLDKRTYQLNPANAREALQEAMLDEAEGADLLMVKPAGAYLDIIREVRDNTLLPVVAYQVSGEYSQIHAAARLGWLDYAKTRDEALLAIKRAGADLIITYFAKEVAEALRTHK
jgi:porphobilinogen synthase